MDPMKNISLSVIQREMIKEFQCSGCPCGSDPMTCSSFKLVESNGSFTCGGWSPGTFLLGVGNIALGLPTGFNKMGTCMTKEHIRSGFFIVMFDSPDDIPQKNGNDGIFDGWYNQLNVPVWAMEKDGFLFVKVLSPRKMEFRIEIIRGGTLDLFKNYEGSPIPIDVSTFIDQID